MKTLTELLESLSPAQLLEIHEGKLRAYKVTPPDGLSQYILSNSQGSAAMEVCEVETCAKKDVYVAMLDKMRRDAEAKEQQKKKGE